MLFAGRPVAANRCAGLVMIATFAAALLANAIAITNIFPWHRSWKSAQGMTTRGATRPVAGFFMAAYQISQMLTYSLFGFSPERVRARARDVTWPLVSACTKDAIPSEDPVFAERRRTRASLIAARARGLSSPAQKQRARDVGDRA